jgi:hypothetical protein
MSTKSGVSAAVDALQKDVDATTKVLMPKAAMPGKYFGNIYRAAENFILNVRLNERLPLCRKRNSIRWAHVVRTGTLESHVMTPVWNQSIKEVDPKTKEVTYRYPLKQTQTIDNPADPKKPLLQAVTMDPPGVPSWVVLEPAGTWLGATGQNRPKIERRMRAKGGDHSIWAADMDKASNAITFDGHAYDLANSRLIRVNPDGSELRIDSAMDAAFDKLEAFLRHMLAYCIAASTQPQLFERDQRAENPLIKQTLEHLARPAGVMEVKAKEKELADDPELKEYIAECLADDVSLVEAVERARVINQVARTIVGVKWVMAEGARLGKAGGIKPIVTPCIDSKTNEPIKGTRSIMLQSKRYVKPKDGDTKEIQAQKDKAEKHDKRVAAAAAAAAAKRKQKGRAGGVAAKIAEKQKAAAAAAAAADEIGRSAAAEHQAACRDTFQGDFAMNASWYSEHDMKAREMKLSIKKPHCSILEEDEKTGQRRMRVLNSSVQMQKAFNSIDALTVAQKVIEFYTNGGKYKIGHKMAPRSILRITAPLENPRKFGIDPFDVDGIDQDFKASGALADPKLQKQLATIVPEDEEDAAGDAGSDAKAEKDAAPASAAASAAAKPNTDEMPELPNIGEGEGARSAKQSDAGPQVGAKRGRGDAEQTEAAAAAPASAAAAGGNASAKPAADGADKPRVDKRARTTHAKNRAAAAAAAAGVNDDDGDLDLT